MCCDPHYTMAPLEDDQGTRFCDVPGTSQTRVFGYATSATDIRNVRFTGLFEHPSHRGFRLLCSMYTTKKMFGNRLDLT